MKEHLVAIGQMLIDFKNEHKMGNELNISGTVRQDSSYYLNLDSVNFNDKTVGEVKRLSLNLYQKIRNYLKENNIKEVIKISTRKDVEFNHFFNGFAVSYEVIHTTKG